MATTVRPDSGDEWDLSVSGRLRARGLPGILISCLIQLATWGSAALLAGSPQTALWLIAGGLVAHAILLGWVIYRDRL
jgi:hypothetical protein